MAMYNRQVGKNGLLNVTGMFSFDPFTVGEDGYPLLFQSGESYKGKALVDRQHPHDLFAALSVGYTQRLSKKVDVFGYIGYPGEPAISAPAFMHRISALNDPDALLSLIGIRSFNKKLPLHNLKRPVFISHPLKTR